MANSPGECFFSEHLKKSSLINLLKQDDNNFLIGGQESLLQVRLNYEEETLKQTKIDNSLTFSKMVLDPTNCNLSKITC